MTASDIEYLSNITKSAILFHRIALKTHTAIAFGRLTACVDLFQCIKYSWLCSRCQNWWRAMINMFLLSRGVEEERGKPGVIEDWHANSCPGDINNLIPVTSSRPAVAKRDCALHSSLSLLPSPHADLKCRKISAVSHCSLYRRERTKLRALWAWVTCEFRLLKNSQMYEQ